jgi:hypothetical protein
MDREIFNSRKMNHFVLRKTEHYMTEVGPAKQSGSFCMKDFFLKKEISKKCTQLTDSFCAFWPAAEMGDS